MFGNMLLQWVPSWDTFLCKLERKKMLFNIESSFLADLGPCIFHWQRMVTPVFYSHTFLSSEAWLHSWKASCRKSVLPWILACFLGDSQIGLEGRLNNEGSCISASDQVFPTGVRVQLWSISLPSRDKEREKAQRLRKLSSVKLSWSMQLLQCNLCVSHQGRDEQMVRRLSLIQ